MRFTARVVILPPDDGPLRVEEVILPEPDPHQVVVEQIASGICRSQLNRMQRARTAAGLLGHESTGVVVDTGRGVSRVAVGDRVLVTWMPSPVDGAWRRPAPISVTISSGCAGTDNVFTWADRTLIDEMFLLPIGEDIDPVLAAVVGCAVMTGAGSVRSTSPVSEGQSVAVIGVGGVGLCAVAAASILGARPVIAVDPSAGNRDLAVQFGATHVVDPAAADPVDVIRALTSSDLVLDSRGQPVAGADHVIDFVALPQTLQQALAATRPGVLGVCRGGTAVLVGTPKAGWDVDPVDLLLGEKRIAGSMGGSCRPDRDLPVYLDWIRSGALPLHKLVTHRFHLDEINEATDALRSGAIAGRAVLTFDD